MSRTLVPTGGPFRGELSSSKGGAVCGDHPDGPLGPAFTHVSPRSMPLPVLIAVPHAGRAYPSETLSEMRDEDLSRLRLEDRHVDKLGVEIAKETGTGLLVAHAPRAVLDLNRASDDIDWDMIAGGKGAQSAPDPVHTGTYRRARSGLGLVPRRLPGFGEIWRGKLPRDELQRRIDCIHRPYHEFLSSELERIREAWGAALLIDLHSMPPLRRQHGQAEPARIVLGDRFGTSCNGRLISRAIQFLNEQGFPVAHNRPYSGGYVLDRHSSPSRGIHAMQVEVCRTTYLDDTLSETSAALAGLARTLAGMVRELGAETAHLGADGQMAQAAE